MEVDDKKPSDTKTEDIDFMMNVTILRMIFKGPTYTSPMVHKV